MPNTTNTAIKYIQCANAVLGMTYINTSDITNCTTMYSDDTAVCPIFNSFAIS